MADDPENNPLMAVGHLFTSTLHHSSYPAISPSRSDFSNKTIVLVGGSRGIGKAIALSFAQAGASNIAICARSTKSLADVAEAAKAAAKAAGRYEPHVLCVELDVTSESSVGTAAKQIEVAFGAVDVLVQNSGILDSGSITEMDPTAWWKVFQVNVYGPFLAVRSFMPLLLKGTSKQIVITSSVGSWLVGPGVSAYQMSKLAVLRFADFVNAEYGEKGISAFCVHPGNVFTDIVGGEDTEMPIKHLFVDKPELAADTIVYLTNEKRAWLGGRYISVTWDMPELLSREKEIVEEEKLKITMKV